MTATAIGIAICMAPHTEPEATDDDEATQPEATPPEATQPEATLPEAINPDPAWASVELWRPIGPASIWTPLPQRFEYLERHTLAAGVRPLPQRFEYLEQHTIAMGVRRRAGV